MVCAFQWQDLLSTYQVYFNNKKFFKKTYLLTPKSLPLSIFYIFVCFEHRTLAFFSQKAFEFLQGSEKCLPIVILPRIWLTSLLAAGDNRCAFQYESSDQLPLRFVIYDLCPWVSGFLLFHWRKNFLFGVFRSRNLPLTAHHIGRPQPGRNTKVRTPLLQHHQPKVRINFRGPRSCELDVCLISLNISDFGNLTFLLNTWLSTLISLAKINKLSLHLLYLPPPCLLQEIQ